MNTYRRIAFISALVLIAATLGHSQEAPSFANFTPQFQNDVFVVNPYVPDPASLIQKKTQVNPAYALSETSALGLQAVLKEFGVVIFHSGPFGWLTSGQFTVTRAVPWLLFPDGTVCNAGLIAWYWSHGFPPVLVWQWVKSDIAVMLQWTADHPDAYTGIVRLP